MVTGLRLENGQLNLDGYPEGSSTLGITGPVAERFCRLNIFRGDLQRITEWMALAELERETRPEICNGLYDAALVSFRRFFKNARSGLLSQPLSKKKIFSKDDRLIFESLVFFRDNHVAHDNQLYPGDIPLLMVNGDADAIEAVVIRIKFPFSGTTHANDLRRLAKIALTWVEAELEVAASKIVSEFNMIPAAERRVLRDSTPMFSIRLDHSEGKL